MNQLRVAVVGCGRMGVVRALSAQRHPARVVAVVDPDQHRAMELAAQLPDCKTLGSAEELDWRELDAVFVCTPPAERGPVEVAAIRRGIPVFVEKPVGLNAQHVAPIAAALEARPTMTAVGYMNRYRASVQRARALVDPARLLAVSADWLVGQYQVPWWKDRSLSGGPINEQATHLIDLARYLVGEITHTQAFATRLADCPEVAGTASINMRFETGQLFSMLYSCQAKGKMIRLTLYMDDRAVTLDGWNFRLVDNQATSAVNDPATAALEIDHRPRNAIFEDEVDAFLGDVEAGAASRVLSDFTDALKTQRAVDTLNQAVERQWSTAP